MASTPYLFDELNREPRAKPVGRRRAFALSPEVREALARLERALDAIPPSEWEARKRRWDDLQRDLRRQRPEPADEAAPSRSAALMPVPRRR